MNKLFFFILLQVLLIPCIKSEAQNWEWIKHFGGKGTDFPRSFDIDSRDNLYILFLTDDTITIENETVYNGTYLAKFDSSGTLLWIKPAPINGSLIKIDKMDNIIIAESFYSYGGTQFISKYDSSFTPLWTKQIEHYPNRGVHVMSISTDFNNNILISGTFNGWMSFDNDTLFACNIYCDNDAFVIKINPFGEYVNSIQIKLLTSCNDDDHFLGSIFVETDNMNNIFFTGIFSGIIQINTNTFYSSSGITEYCPEMFLCKYDSSFNYKWSKLFKSGCFWGRSTITSDNIFVGGSVKGAILLDDTLIAGSNSNYNAYLLKFDTLGHFLRNVWGSIISPPDTMYLIGEAYFNSIFIDSTGNFIVGGTTFLKATIMVIGSDTINTIPNGASSSILKFNNNFDLLWYKQVNFTNYNSSGSLYLSNNRTSVYCWGNFNDTAFFDDSVFISKGQGDFYIAKLNNYMNSINIVMDNKEQITVYPNPTAGVFTLTKTGVSDNINNIEIYNTIGNKIYQSTFETNTKSINISQYPKGIYIVKAYSGNNVFVEKVVYQ